MDRSPEKSWASTAGTLFQEAWRTYALGEFTRRYTGQTSTTKDTPSQISLKNQGVFIFTALNQLSGRPKG